MSTPQAPLVELQHATIGYEVAVLRDIDVSIQAHDFVAIVGPNGAGKSTLVKGILGLAAIESGTAQLFGVPVADFDQHWRIGYVPQRHTVGGPIAATVREVVNSGRLPRSGFLRWSSPTDRRAVEEAMERVRIADLARRPVHQLSGGQQRRVLIARALAAEAEFMLLDEPTAGVDVDAQASVVEVLGDLSLTGVTIAVVTHDLEPFTAQLTRVMWVSRGRITYDGPPTPAIVAAASEPFSHHDHVDEPTRDAMPDDLRTGG
jgi:zinc transport system ATP-binding protein